MLTVEEEEEEKQAAAEISIYLSIYLPVYVRICECGAYVSSVARVDLCAYLRVASWVLASCLQFKASSSGRRVRVPRRCFSFPFRLDSFLVSPHFSRLLVFFSAQIGRRLYRQLIIQRERERER